MWRVLVHGTTSHARCVTLGCMAGSKHDRPRTLGQAGIFATTHWSEVLTAEGDSSPAAQEALEQLCRTYWYPLYAYVRRQGHSPEDAQDLTQAFFAFVLDKQVVGQADPQKGRFRSFLLSSLKHFLADERDRALAQKRGGGKEVISLDAHRAEEWYHREPADTLTSDRIFERRWAVTVLEQALAKMRAEQLSTGKAEQFDVLADYLLEDTRRVSWRVPHGRWPPQPSIAHHTRRRNQPTHPVRRQRPNRLGSLGQHHLPGESWPSSAPA